MSDFEDPIARYVRVVTGKEVFVVPNAKSDFVSGNVMWLRHIPDDADGLARISWREEHPAFMGRLMHLISHMRVERKEDDEPQSWNDAEIEAIGQLLKDKPLLNYALKTWLMDQIEDADESTKKGLIRIGESTGLVYKEEAEELLKDTDNDIEESDITPCTDYGNTSALGLELDFPAEASGESQDGESEEGDTESADSEQAENSAESEGNDNAKSSEQQNQYFNESEPNPFAEIAEAGSKQEEEAKRTFEKKNYEIVKQERKDIRKARREADKTFPKGSLDVRTRKPNVEDRNLRTKLTKALRNARWRAPARSEVQSPMPPGRLSSRDAVLWAAQESMDMPITAKPFIQERIQSREGPPPYLGMACDVSGSMGESEKPMSSLIWAMSHAVPTVGGKFAAVSFDRQVKSLAKPGKRLPDVPLVKAKGNYEAAYQAIQSLVGGLDLLNPQKGVRVLLISSDAMWRKQEIERSKPLLKSLSRSGVHVLWVTFQVGIGIAELKASDAIFSDIGTIIEFESMDDIALGLGRAISQIVERV